MKHENGNDGRTRRALICAFAFPIALVGGGCELLPGLVSSPTTGPTRSESFDVTVVEISGTLGGLPIERDSVRVTGARTGMQTVFDLRFADRETILQIDLQPSDNPYGGRPGEPRVLDAGFAPVLRDAGPPPPLPDGAPPPTSNVGRVGAGPVPSVVACTPGATECWQATEVKLEDRQGLDARALVLEGRWDSGDTLHLELRYATVD